MNSFLIKTYIELGYLVINSDVTIKKFSDEFNLSNYELKKDLDAINELGKIVGIEIRYDNDIIHYDVSDTNLYEKYKRNFPVFYYNSRYHEDNEDMFLSSFIIKYILLNMGRYITIEELADIIGFSKSKLRNPIKEARNALNNYGFNLRNVSHHGLIIENTDEYRIRLCLTMQYLTFDIRCFYNDEVDKEFNDFFSRYSEVLDIIDNTTGAYKRTIVKSERKKLAYFLIVQATRFYNEHNIALDKIDVSLINKIKRYPVIVNIANNIAKDISTLYDFGKMNKQEIDYICILLVATMGFPDISNEIINELYINEKNELYKLVFEFFEMNYHLQINDIYRNSLEIALNFLLVKNKINMLNVRGMAVNGRSINFSKAPLANKMIKELNNILIEYFQSYIPITQLIDIIDILIIYLSSLKIDYIRPNIAITSRNSNFEPLLIDNLIRSDVDDETYGKLDIIEYDNIYPENIAKIKDYDEIFCDQQLVYDDRLELYNDDIFEVNSLNKRIRKSRDYLHRYLKDEDILIEDLTYEELMGIISSMKKNNDYLIINKTLFFICKSNINKLRTGSVNDGEVKNYVIVEMNINESVIAFFHVLLSKLANDYDYLFELINGNIKIINEIMIDVND